MNHATWQCPHCGDWYDPDDDDTPPVCIMCRKADRTPRPAAELKELADYYQSHDTSADMEHGTWIEPHNTGPTENPDTSPHSPSTDSAQSSSDSLRGTRSPRGPSADSQPLTISACLGEGELDVAGLVRLRSVAVHFPALYSPHEYQGGFP